MRTRPGKRLRGAAGMATLALVAASGVAALASEPTAAAAPPSSACQLGNGVKHVVSLVFDNVHFFRDNPNVPSDLEQMPHLMNFLKSNGTVLSNVHTPLIAHTADDSLTIYTGLYGDRHGQPVSNSYKTYNPDGTTDPATSFAYWTAPVSDTANPPTPGHDTTPSMVYSDTVPATPGATDRQTPAPWVPFTRAGCTVGDFSTANMVLENVPRDLPAVFGPNSPEAAQAAADPDPFKDAEVADYIGEAVHCAQGDVDLRERAGGEVRPDLAVAHRGRGQPADRTGRLQRVPGIVRRKVHRAATRRGHAEPLPQRLPGHQRGGQPRRPRRQRRSSSAFSEQPGFPGFNPTATQTLAYLADMQETGIPVTYGYISDLHERKAGTSGCTTADAPPRPVALGPVTAATSTNAKAYDDAFETFFERLAADGITPANTLLRDRRRGERPVRRRQRRPSDRTDTGRLRRRYHDPCNYATDRSASCREHQGPAVDTSSSGTAVRHRAARRGDLRTRAAGR